MADKRRLFTSVWIFALSLVAICGAVVGFVTNWLPVAMTLVVFVGATVVGTPAALNSLRQLGQTHKDTDRSLVAGMPAQATKKDDESEEDLAKDSEMTVSTKVARFDAPSPPAQGVINQHVHPIRLPWTRELRAVLRALAAELPTHADMIGCARQASVQLQRVHFAAAPDTTWQSMMEIAWEDRDTECFQRLLSTAAEKSRIVADAVHRYRLAGQSGDA
jgi:hypothetical protein